MATKAEIIARCKARYPERKPHEERFEELSGLEILTRERAHFFARSVLANRHRQTVILGERGKATDGKELDLSFLEKEMLRILRDHLFHCRTLLPESKFVPDSEIEKLIVLPE